MANRKQILGLVILSLGLIGAFWTSNHTAKAYAIDPNATGTTNGWTQLSEPFKNFLMSVGSISSSDIANFKNITTPSTTITVPSVQISTENVVMQIGAFASDLVSKGIQWLFGLINQS